MKLTSKSAGLGLMAVAGLMLASAGIADTMGQMGGKGGPGMMMGSGQALDIATVDTDKDGKISKAELDAFRAAKVAEVDADKDGKLSAEELAAMHIKAMTERANDMAARMIERLDSDGDGLLSAAEMASRPLPEALFDRIDANGDGFIDQDEIDAAKARMMERMGGRGGHGHGRGGHGMGDHDMGDHEMGGDGMGWMGGDDN